MLDGMLDGTLDGQAKARAFRLAIKRVRPVTLASYWADESGIPFFSGSGNAPRLFERGAVCRRAYVMDDEVRRLTLAS
jgi:hypothetical protein